MEDKMEKKNVKYAIGILAAVTVVIGALAGGLVSAEENAEINKFAKLFDINTVQEHLSSKGFEVTFEGETITAYRETPGRTMTMTIECPDGECAKPEPPEGNMHGQAFGMKKHFRFRMFNGPFNGPKNPAEFQAKLEQMGITQENIDAMNEKLAGMGFKGCPFAETAE